jgi:thiosulfate dehydrogenase [quinone] large subunit
METGKLTRLQMIALALLRILIGWHFLYEGIAKLMKPNWSASSFLVQARGPLAGFYHWMANSPEALSYVNSMNIWGLILIGLGLILGCFTRTASGAGILLILLYYFCNPPFAGYFYSIPSEGNYLIVDKNLVEAAALLVTLALAAGRFYGIDHIFHALRAGRQRAALKPEIAPSAQN